MPPPRSLRYKIRSALRGLIFAVFMHLCQCAPFANFQLHEQIPWNTIFVRIAYHSLGGGERKLRLKHAVNRSCRSQAIQILDKFKMAAILDFLTTAFLPRIVQTVLVSLRAVICVTSRRSGFWEVGVNEITMYLCEPKENLIEP